jgi:hypothetical protein
MAEHRSYITIRHAGRQFPSRSLTATGTPRQVERAIRTATELLVGASGPKNLLRLPQAAGRRPCLPSAHPDAVAAQEAT